MFARVTVAGGVSIEKGTQEEWGDWAEGEGSEISPRIWGMRGTPSGQVQHTWRCVSEPGVEGTSADFNVEVLSL